MPIDVGTTTSVPPIAKILPSGLGLDGKIEMKAQNGETLVIDQQVQLYTENSLVTHPLVSSCTAYLGGLPPLMVITGDGEVLRDEVIYM
jgi:acetyl esterase/lipase